MPGNSSGSERIAGVELTHPDRVLYRGQGLTKRDLARYYERVAESMLPELGGRPLSLLRCPSGQGEECFYQKHLSETFPDAVGRLELREKGKETPQTYATAGSASALVGLVQMGVLEIHVWGARHDRLERPDRMVFDLDPDEGLAWERVLEATRAVGERLDELGLRSFVKTTGGKGLHVVVPLTRRQGWEEVKAFAAAIAAELTGRDPDRYTDNARKRQRRGRVFIDYLRNSRGATYVAPYSTRARPGAPVSVPVGWSELSPELRSDEWNIDTLPRRLDRLDADPWAGIAKVDQSITRDMRRALGLEG